MCTPVVSVLGEAEAGESLEPRSLRPTWATQGEFTSLKDCTLREVWALGDTDVCAVLMAA